MTSLRIVYRTWRLLFTALLLLGVLLGVLLALNTQPYTEGVSVTKLHVDGCQLTHFTPQSQQPYRTVTLDCAGVDSIRLWPWPVLTPWFEDWHELQPCQECQEV